MTWSTAAEITEIFSVGEQKLLQFSRRGNLASRLDATGVRFYSFEGVERLFPRRGSAALLPRSAAHFGTLGGLTLGAAADAENSRISRLPTRVKAPQEEAPLAAIA